MALLCCLLTLPCCCFGKQTEKPLHLLLPSRLIRNRKGPNTETYTHNHSQISLQLVDLERQGHFVEKSKRIFKSPCFTVDATISSIFHSFKPLRFDTSFFAMSRSTLKDFDVISRLGAGSFGTVYKAKRIIDEKLYVMKVVRIGELSHRERSDAINEVQILAQLKSSFVVCYYDSFIEKDNLHIGTFLCFTRCLA